MSLKKFLPLFCSIAFGLSSTTTLAAQTCDEKMHDLIVSNIPVSTTFPYTVRNDKSLVIDLEGNKDGLYDVELSAKRFGLTVYIDTNKNAIYYSTDAKDSSKYWKVSSDTIKDFANSCFKEVVPGNLEVTDLPISIYAGNPHGWPECEGHAHAMNHCGLKFHEYSRDQLDPAISKQVDDKLINFLKLPSLSDLSVYLGKTTAAEGDIYMLYVFKGNSVVTKEVIAKNTNQTILNFDLYKDYSIHLNLQNRVGPQTENDDGMHYTEIYKKLDTSGKLLKCTKLNVSCK